MIGAGRLLPIKGNYQRVTRPVGGLVSSGQPTDTCQPAGGRVRSQILPNTIRRRTSVLTRY